MLTKMVGPEKGQINIGIVNTRQVVDYIVNIRKVGEKASIELNKRNITIKATEIMHWLLAFLRTFNALAFTKKYASEILMLHLSSDVIHMFINRFSVGYTRMITLVKRGETIS